VTGSTEPARNHQARHTAVLRPGRGNICAPRPAKDHVNVFLYDGGIVPGPDEIITRGYGNKTARAVAIRAGETINAPRSHRLFRQIIIRNRASGRRMPRALTARAVKHVRR